MKTQNFLRRLFRKMLDVHSALGACHDQRARCLAIQNNAQVEFFRDIKTLLNEHFVNDFAFRPRLRGHQRLAQQLRGFGGSFGGAFRQLDSSTLAAAACMDLRFDHNHRSAELLRRSLRFLRRICKNSVRHSNVVSAK